MMATDMGKSRSTLLKTSVVATAGVLASGAMPIAAAADRPRRKFQLALASYTTRKFDLDQTLAMANRVGGPLLTSSARAIASNSTILRGSKSKIRRFCVGRYPAISGYRTASAWASS